MSTLSQTKFKRENLAGVLNAISANRATGRLVLTKDATGDTINNLVDVVIYFDNSQVIAAQSGSLAGLEAIREVFTWESGSFYFVPEPVTRSSLAKLTWINLALPALLLEINPAPFRHKGLNVTSIPRLIQQNDDIQVQVAAETLKLFPYLNGSYRIGHISQATGMTLSTLQSLLKPLLEAGFLELLDAPIVSSEIATTPQSVSVLTPSKPLSRNFINDLERVLKQLIGPFGGVLLEDAAENIGTDIDALTSKDLQAWLTALKVLIPIERGQVFEAQLEPLIKKHFD